MFDKLKIRLAEDANGFSTEHGNFHDCRVVKMGFEPPKNKFVIAVDDLFSNFLGLPEYKGPLPASFSLNGVTELDMNLDAKNGELNIYDMEFTKNAEQSGFNVEIKFSPGGSTSVLCNSIEIDG